MRDCLVLFAALLLATLATEVHAGPAFTVTRLTTNSKVDSNPQVFGSDVVWQGIGGSDAGADYEIFRYDGSTTTQLTTNTDQDQTPNVSSGGVVWVRGTGTASEIIYNNFSGETPVTTNSLTDGNAVIGGSRITWVQGSGTAQEVMSYSGGVTTNLSSNSVADRLPAISGANTVWTSGSTPSAAIKSNSGSGAVTIGTSALGLALENPKVSGNNAVWEGFAGTTSNDREIYMYNGSSVTRLTTNSFPDFAPQIQGSTAVWWGGVFDNFQIYLYDGTVHQISSGTRNQFPQIDGQYVVWQGYDGSHNQIYLWDGIDVTPLTTGNYDSTAPQISGNRIVWTGTLLPSDGTSQEIFMAVLVPEPATWTIGASGLAVLAALSARGRWRRRLCTSRQAVA